ncbi:DEAD/DEAH box helicase, partial [Microterricola pindariensis]
MTDTAIPEITYPPELPVSAMRDEIADAIRDNQVVIVAGATGSGKTTQIPKICLELGRTSIGHTQPRRLAARTIAERIAEELGQEVGGLVGYQVRFTDKATASTRVKLMTDGILLNEMHRDRLLRRYDTIIIDEAHERSLNIDFLLGYLKELLPKRPDLKVIVTSATIDPESFAKHFADADGTPAKIIEVSGRTYPVEIRYRPLVAEESLDEDDEEQTGAANPADDKDYLQGILEALDELNRESSGDVLVFLSGENEIRDA